MALRFASGSVTPAGALNQSIVAPRNTPEHLSFWLGLIRLIGTLTVISTKRFNLMVQQHFAGNGFVAENSGLATIKLRASFACNPKQIWVNLAGMFAVVPFVKVP